MLADKIIADPKLLPWFKGVAIGNGILSEIAQSNSVVPLMYSHLLVGERLWQKLADECCDGNAGNCDYYSIMLTKNLTWNCYKWTLLISNMPAVVGLDPYNLYDTCYVDTSIQTRTRSVEYLQYLKKYDVDIETIREIARENGIDPVYADSNTIVPECYYEGYEFYLQRADVRNALHIPDWLPPWQDCNYAVNGNYSQLYVNQIDHIMPIIHAKVPVLCYNGDVDTVCNALGDMRFVANLNQTQIGKTVPWNYTQDTFHVAGWQSRYEGIDFITVRGSGHYVPHDKPREALQMITNFIRGLNYTTPTGLDVSPQPLIGGSAISAKSLSFGRLVFISISFLLYAYH